MPLGKSTVFVNLGGGLRRDIADLMIPIGQGSLGLLNAVFNRTGEIAKRKGSLALSNTTTTGGTLPASWQLATLNGDLVSLAYSGTKPIATYSETAAKWLEPVSDMRGPVALSKMPVNDFVGAGAATAGLLVFASDLAYSSGYYLAAYRDQTGPTSYFDLIDSTTGAKLASFTAPTSYAPKCRFVSGLAVGLYITNAGALRKVTFNLSTFAVTDSAVNALAAVATDGIMDVRNLPGTGGIAALYKDNGGLLHETIFTSSLVASEYLVTDQTNTPINGLLMWSYVQPISDDGSVRSIVAFTTFAGLRAHFSLATSGGNQRAALSVVLDAGANTAVIVGAAAYTIATFGDIQVLWTRADASGTTAETHGVQYLTGVISGPAVLYRQLGIASKAWTRGGRFYVMARDQFGTGFIVQSEFTGTPAPVIRAYRGTFGSLGVGYQPNVPTIDGNPRILVANVLSVDAGTQAETRGIEILGVDYASASTAPTTGPAVEAIGSLFVPTGGQLAQWDGRFYAEAGLPYAPTIETATPVAGGSLTADSTYRYQAVYLVVDNNGNTWRSQPSLPKDVAISGANQSVTLAFRFLNLTGRPDSAIWVEIYRSSANDSSLLTLVTRIPNNALAAGLGSYTDTTADTVIANALPIYTTGGIAESEPLPPTNVALFALNRMWIVDADNPTRLWPSKSVIPGQGFRFAEEDAITLADVSATPITALAALDDKVIVFKSDRIYAVTGDGADQAGVGAFNVNTIAIGMGTDNPRSVVTFAHGLIFKSPAGYQLMDRGLSVSSPIPGTTMIGQPLRDVYNAIVPIAAVHIPSRSQIRLYNRTGRTLVLDYVSWAWSVFELQQADTATVWKGLGAYWNNAVMAENELVYTENGTLYGLTVATPFISMAQVGGFERVYRFQGVGLTRGDHTINITPFINGDTETDLGTKSRAMLETEVVWPWEYRPRIQKVSSVQLTITETASSGAGPIITGISMIVGIKQGLRKLYAPTVRVT